MFFTQAPPPTDSSRLGAGAAAVANAAGHELADFAHRELLLGLTTTGMYSSRISWLVEQILFLLVLPAVTIAIYYFCSKDQSKCLRDVIVEIVGT